MKERAILPTLMLRDSTEVQVVKCEFLDGYVEFLLTHVIARDHSLLRRAANCEAWIEAVVAARFLNAGEARIVCDYANLRASWTARKTPEEVCDSLRDILQASNSRQSLQKSVQAWFSAAWRAYGGEEEARVIVRYVQLRMGLRVA